ATLEEPLYELGRQKDRILQQFSPETGSDRIHQAPPKQGLQSPLTATYLEKGLRPPEQAHLLVGLLVPADLADALGVAAALEVGGQPDAHHAVDQPLAQQVRRQAQHVGVVVAAAHLRRDAVVARGGAHALDLVRGDAHADAGAADQDAAL